MKIVATSDLHGYLPRIPECDIFLIAGDVTPVHNHDPEYQMDWLARCFAPWLEELPAKHVAWTPGNHDFCLEPASGREFAKTLPGHCLIDREIELEGVRIYGTPWTPAFNSWAFMTSEASLESLYGEIPPNIDILLSHGPPKGYCDRTMDGTHVGSNALTNRIKALPSLPYVVCGHIHEAYGSSLLNRTDVYNVSLVNSRYSPVNSPVELHLWP